MNNFALDLVKRSSLLSLFFSTWGFVREHLVCLRCPQCGTATTKEVDRTQFLLDIIIWAWLHPCLCWALISLSRINLPSPPFSSYHFIIQLRLGLSGKRTNSVLLWFLKDFHSFNLIHSSHSSWSKRKIELKKKLHKIRLRQTWTFAVHCGASLSMQSAVESCPGALVSGERPGRIGNTEKCVHINPCF